MAPTESPTPSIYLNPAWNSDLMDVDDEDAASDSDSSSCARHDPDHSETTTVTAPGCDTDSNESLSSSKAITENTKPTFPPEIWAKILGYADSFTVWVKCRQVCHMLRAEAEREFQITRSAELNITLKFLFYPNDETAANGPDDWGNWAVDLYAEGVRRFSEDKSLAYYDFGIRSHNPGHLYFERRDNKNLGPIEKAAILDCLGYPEHTYLQHLRRCCDYPAYEWDMMNSIEIKFEGSDLCCVDIPWKELDLQNCQISVDWKRLLNSFFKGEACVRNGEDTEHLTDTRLSSVAPW